MPSTRVQDIHGRGLHAAKPAASSGNVGYLWFSTDVNGGTLYRSDGATWEAVSVGVTPPIADGTITSAKFDDTTTKEYVEDKVAALIDDSATVTWVYTDGSASLVGSVPDNAITQAKMADDSVGAAEIITGAVGTSELADASVTNAKLNADVPRLNLVTNGGLDIWQRGAGPFTATNAYTADRWQIVLAGSDTLQVDRETTIKSTNSLTSAKCTFVLGSGAGATVLKQRLTIADGFHGLLGKAISELGALRANAATAVRLFIKTDGTGGTTTYSSYAANAASFADYSVLNVTIPTDATYIEVGAAFAANVTAYLDNVMVLPGAVAANYLPLHPADEQLRCERYLEIMGGEATFQRFGMGQCGSAVDTDIACFYRTQKAVTPTLTFSTASNFAVTSSTGSATTVTTLPTSAITKASFEVAATVAAGLTAGNATMLLANGTTNAKITIESNP